MNVKVVQMGERVRQMHREAKRQSHAQRYFSFSKILVDIFGTT